MKKIAILAAAAVALASCSKDKMIEAGSSDAISFKPLTTKATEVSTTTLPNFTVYAYYDASSAGMSASLNPGFMNAQPVTGGHNAWTYTPTKYWPSSGQLHFFAYSPTGDNGVTFAPASGAGLPEITYTVPTAVADQNDFLVAQALDQTKSTPVAPVSLTFDHALSQIVFKAQSGAETLEFEILNIEILNVNSTGTYNLYSNTWSMPVPTVPVTYAASLNTAVAGTIRTTMTDLTGGDGTLMLIPQTLTEGDPETDATLVSGGYLRVTYNAKDIDSNAPIAVNKEKVIGLDIAWEAGKKYTYELTLNGGTNGGTDPEDLEPITFTTSVSDWTDVTPGTGVPL